MTGVQTCALPICNKCAQNFFNGILHCLIAGNHDSAERLSFGAKLMDGRGVYFAPVYDGAVRCVTLQDGFGPVHLWLLPFLKLGQLKCRREAVEEFLRKYEGYDVSDPNNIVPLETGVAE